jgi:TfoX N-terminal domain
MAYDTALAGRVRTYPGGYPHLVLEEKKMFRGLCFMVNGKMCVCVSNENLLCRFDPALHQQLLSRPGFLPMIMRNKIYQGYCCIAPAGIKTEKPFAFWMNTCLAFNENAKASRKGRAPVRYRN